MKIGIISDTHDQAASVLKAISLFNSERVQLVYHLGDWCSPFTVVQFKELKCPLKSVFGNNDADIFKIMRYKPDNVEFFDRFLSDVVDGKRIAALHGDPQDLVDSVVQARKHDIVLRGHNHVAEITMKDGVLVINPGNLIGPIPGFMGWTKPSVAILDTKGQPKIIPL